MGRRMWDTKFKWQRKLMDLKPQKRGGLKIQTNTGVGDHQQIMRKVKEERKKRIDKRFLGGVYFTRLCDAA